MQSPTKEERAKLKQKKKKNLAFQSFLQQGSSQIDIQTANHSDNEENVTTLTNECLICQKEIGEDRKRYCGFCKGLVCSEHMRKKRKNKVANKFMRICDYCQDKYLYEKYMKLELKNQESLTAQETIIGTKRDELLEQLNGRKTRLQLLYNKQNQILQEGKSQRNKFTQQQNDILSKKEKLQKRIQTVEEQAQRLTQIQQKLPPALQEDFTQLESQNQKIVKDLVKFDKLCAETIKIKSKREKEVYEQYYQWQNKQKQQISKKDEDCSIF